VLVVMGGSKDDGTALDDAFSLIIPPASVTSVDVTWNIIEATVSSFTVLTSSNPLQGKPPPRYGASGFIYSNHIFLFGGIS
jgi:hypothetical protein